MEDLGAEVGQLSGLVEIEAMDGRGTLDDTWVIVVHAIDVGPDLYFGGADGGPDERSGVVAATTLEVVDLAIGIATDVAFGDEELFVGILIEEVEEVLLDKEGVRLGILIGAHEVEGR